MLDQIQNKVCDNETRLFRLFLCDSSVKMAEINGSSLNQFLAAFVVNILAFAHGSASGWLSPFLPLLRSDSTPLESGIVTTEEASWIGAIFCVGGVAGTITYGYISDRFGKKIGIMVMTMTHIGFWICILFGTQVYHLYIARLLAGATGGGVMRVIPLFIADIADSKIRGTLGSMTILILNFGVLNIYVMGSFLSYTTVPMIMLALPILFLIVMSFLPETPYCLLKNNKPEEAKKSLMFYRGFKEISDKNTEFNVEFQNLQNSLVGENVSSKVTLKDFAPFDVKKGMAMGIFIMMLNQFSGCFAVLTYAATIFEESGSGLSPNLSSIIMATIQILGTLVSFILVDKVGRKILLAVSALGTGIGFGAMGLFSSLRANGVDVTSFDWVPVTSVSFAIFIASIGILPLPYIVVAELLPQKIRGVGSSISMSTIAICAFAILKLFPVLLETIMLHGTMWIFSSSCFFGTIVIVFFLPETKGKNLVTMEVTATINAKDRF